MKNRLLLIILVSSFSVFSQTKYTITVSSSENLKGLMNELTRTINPYNRHIYHPNILTFSTEQQLSDEYFITKVGDGIIVSISREKTVKSIISEKAGGTDCEEAQVLCSNTSLPGNSSGYGIQELDINNDGCLYEENQSSWYYMNVLVGGELQFRIDPDTGDDDYDFAVWGPFTAASAGANCPPITEPIRCNYSAEYAETGLSTAGTNNYEPQEGPGFSNPLNVLAGEIYILLIDNYSISNSGYNLDFSWTGHNSTAILGCETVVLPIELIHFSGENKIDNILSWSTASELNNDYFSIEHSEDGVHWNRFGYINGAGNSSVINHYILHHSNYKNVLNYYRLSQTDFDGQKRIFSTIVIDNSFKNKSITLVTNLLGQEVNEEYEGIRIIRFDDGTTLKKVGK